MSVAQFQQKLPTAKLTAENPSQAEMVLVRDSSSYNKDIEQISKHQVSGKTVLALIV